MRRSRWDISRPTKKQVQELREYAKQSGEFPSLLKLMDASPQRTRMLIKMLPVIQKVLSPQFKGTIMDLKYGLGIFYGSQLYDEIREFLNMLVELGMLKRDLNEKGAYIYSNSLNQLEEDERINEQRIGRDG